MATRRCIDDCGDREQRHAFVAFIAGRSGLDSRHHPHRLSWVIRSLH